MEHPSLSRPTFFQNVLGALRLPPESLLVQGGSDDEEGYVRPEEDFP